YEFIQLTLLTRVRIGRMREGDGLVPADGRSIDRHCREERRACTVAEGGALTVFRLPIMRNDKPDAVATAESLEGRNGTGKLLADRINIRRLDAAGGGEMRRRLLILIGNLEFRHAASFNDQLPGSDQARDLGITEFA